MSGPSSARKLQIRLGAALLAFSGLACGVATVRAASQRPSPTHPVGYVVVPDTSDQQAIEFEPTGPVPVPPQPRPLQAPAASQITRVILPAPRPAAARPDLVQAPLPLPAMPAVAMSMQQAPPLAVTISFPSARPGARDKADAVARILRSHGMTVDAIEADGHVAARARILFAFEEDRSAADDVNRTLQIAYGVSSPLTLSPGAMAARRPGLIEVALPG